MVSSNATSHADISLPNLSDVAQLIRSMPLRLFSGAIQKADNVAEHAALQFDKTAQYLDNESQQLGAASTDVNVSSLRVI